MTILTTKKLSIIIISLYKNNIIPSTFIFLNDAEVATNFDLIKRLRSRHFSVGIFDVWDFSVLALFELVGIKQIIAHTCMLPPSVIWDYLDYLRDSPQSPRQHLHVNSVRKKIPENVPGLLSLKKLCINVLFFTEYAYYRIVFRWNWQLSFGS